MQRFRFMAAMLAALGCAWPGQAAQAQSLEVEPDQCLDADQIASAMERAGARPVLSSALVVRVTQTERFARFQLLRDDVLLGGRSLDTEGLPCGEVLDAIAIAIAIAIDASSITGPERPAAAPASPPEPPIFTVAPLEQRPGAPDVALPPPERVDRSRPRLASSVDVGAGVGVQPQPGAVASVMFEVAAGPAPNGGVEPEFSARAGLIGALPAATGEEAGAVVTSTVAARLDLCGAVRAEAFRARGCASGVSGALLADGAVLEGRHAAGGRVDGRWMVTPLFGLQAGVDLLVNLAPDFVPRTGEGGLITDLDELGPVALIVSAGPIVEFF